MTVKPLGPMTTGHMIDTLRYASAFDNEMALRFELAGQELFAVATECRRAGMEVVVILSKWDTDDAGVDT